MASSSVTEVHWCSKSRDDSSYRIIFLIVTEDNRPKITLKLSLLVVVSVSSFREQNGIAKNCCLLHEHVGIPLVRKDENGRFERRRLSNCISCIDLSDSMGPCVDFYRIKSPSGFMF